VRQLVGDLPILLPGVGFQGGDLAASVREGSSAPGAGLLCSSSRAILYASAGDDFADAARAVAIATRDAINAAAVEVSDQLHRTHDRSRRTSNVRARR
jgi:orotidine-5'-phosphate decarboxylase